MAQNSDGAQVSRETLGRAAPPCAMVIFGAGGDLTKRKLFPALYNLAKGKLLPQEFAIVGVSREQFSTDDFRQRTSQEIRQYLTGDVDPASWDQFVKRLYYIPGDFKDPELYRKARRNLWPRLKKNKTLMAIVFFIWPLAQHSFQSS